MKPGRHQGRTARQGTQAATTPLGAANRAPGAAAGGASATASDQLVTLEQAVHLAQQHWNSGQAERAERVCRQILAVHSGHPETLHLLGLMALARRETDRAINYLTQACLAPGAPAGFHSNLAELCRRAGRMVEAEAAGRVAVAKDSTFAAGWSNLGIVLQERGKLTESRACLERGVALAPDAADIHSNLGNTLKKLGELNAACRHYARALALAPNYAEAHSNFAITLSELGEHERARGHVRRALGLTPALLDAHINAATIEARLGQHEAALRLLDAAALVVPESARLLTARADILRCLDRPAEALREVERALALDPGNGDACNARALILQMLHRYDEALAAFDRAAAVMQRPAAAATNKAVLLMEIGRTDEAWAAFDHALALQPDLVPAWYNRAGAKRFTPGDPDIAAMHALLEPDGAQAHEDRLWLHFALGKAYLDIGDAEHAFVHLDTGNRMKRAMFSYDVGDSERLMAAIAAQVSAPALDRLRGAGIASEAPIFVIGMPRSGTSLIEQILASHPLVHGAGELTALRQSIDHGLLSNGLAPYPEAIGALRADHLAWIGRAYLDRLTALAPGAARIVDKLPGNFIYAGLIPQILPGARIIHCRRDALDVCVSCYSKLFTGEHEYAYDLAELGRFHRAYAGLVRHWRQILPEAVYLEVDYEAVVDDLAGEARRLIAFCGLPWDDACLTFHATRRPVRTASMNQVRQPIYRGSVGRAQALRAHLGPLVAALGEASGSQIVAPRPAKK